MKDFETFIISFGFKEGPFIIAIFCIVVLLSSFAGGLIGKIMLAMADRPITERPLIQRTSFRLAAASEFCFIAYIVYYHTVLAPGIVIAQAIFWNFFVMAAPLLAMIGAQIGHLIYAKKIDSLKTEAIEIDKQERAEEMAGVSVA